MVSHVASLISTVCDTLEEYFLDQFSPWKIITLSVAITVTVKVKITGVSILKSSPKPASLSDSTFKTLHTFVLLSVYVVIHSVTVISFWQQMPAGHFLVICQGRIFTWWKKIVCSCIFKNSAFSAFPLSFASWNAYFHATTILRFFLIVPLTLLTAHFAAAFKSMLLDNCRYHVHKYGKGNRTNK